MWLLKHTTFIGNFGREPGTKICFCFICMCFAILCFLLKYFPHIWHWYASNVFFTFTLIWGNTCNVCRKKFKIKWCMQKNLHKKDMFHSEILASLNFTKNKILSPGLGNNHTLKCCSGNFPTWSYIPRLLEKCQINFWMYGYSQIQGTRSNKNMEN